MSRQVQGLVAAGTGVALIPRLALGAPRPDLAVRPLAGPVLAREIGVAVLRSASNRAAQELIAALREQAALIADRRAG
ncbi:LysR substrate-binding domain-containing protein [Streptomyces sp. NPDC059556]|uniref:LysR substrate-binding domain-containing protein n=1 Tax=Streptomyces sp. NPDC059556 TaxID=3346863 RepID=UPI00368F4C1B